LFHPDEAKAVEMAKESLGLFTTEFQARWLEVMRAKLGLAEPHDGDAEFVGEFLEWMHGAGLDFTNTFRALDPERPPDAVEIRGWGERWAGRIARQTGEFVRARELMRRANPFVIPRNHRVEEALATAEGGDFSVMEKLMAVLAEPFAESEAALPYAAAPADGGKNHRTFCGT
jgi:uncharacterized protein YdiU (UPF0061 family)